MLKLPVPELRTGKPIVISAPCSRELKEIVQSLVARAEALRSGRIDPREDNILLVTTGGRKAALDLRLHDPRLPDHPNSKVNLAVAQGLTLLNGELAASTALSGAVQSPR